MAMSTQIVLLCLCCLLADSYIFAIDITDGEDHIHIPLHLPNPFDIFHEMFAPPKPHERKHHHHQHKRPFTSEVTTDSQKLKEEIVTTEATLVTTEEELNSEDDIFVKVPDKIERQDPERVNYDDEVKASSEEHNETPQVNTLSIHDEPILSVMISNDNEKITTEIPKLVPTESIERNSIVTKPHNNKTDPNLTKNTDYLIIPVNAVFTTASNPNPEVNESSNTLTKMSGMDNGLNFNQGYPNNGFYPNFNNVNPNPVNLNPVPNFNNMNPNFNSVPYGYQPNQYGNGINQPNQVNTDNLPNSYTMMPVSNLPTLPGYNNLYYSNPNVIQPNSPQQLYNLVPINNNYPNNYGVNQPNNFIPNNQPNNFVPYNNQPINFVPSNPQNNFIPANSNFVPTNNNFVPANNNFVPANNNFVPANNNFVPANNNFVPANNNFVPVNNIPNNNFIPLNNNNPNNVPMNQPYSFIPLNNQPNTIDTNNYNNFIPSNNFNNQPNNFVPVNNVPNNFVPYQGNNFIPYKDQNNGTDALTQPEPTVVTLASLNDKDDAEKVTPQNEDSSDKSSDKGNNDQKD